MMLQAFALLCALATLSCVAGATRPAQLAFVGAGLLAGAVLLLPAPFGAMRAPLVAVEPTQVALLLALLALARLRGNVGTGISMCVGGGLAIVWLQALRAVGWPSFAAVPVVLAVVAVAAIAGMRRAFFPRALQDDVALLMLAGGLSVALVPGILDGWNSAQVMQGAAAESRSGGNVVWVAAGFVVIGAVFAWWKTNRRWSR